MNRFFKNIVFWLMRMLAKIQLAKINPVVIGVGGSSGKSSLANVIEIILSEKYRVKNSSGKNSHSGIPLSIMNVNPGKYTFLDWFRILVSFDLKLITNWKKFDFFVAEMGIDGPNEPNNMSYLLKIVTPTVGVLTNISYEHSVYFEEIAKDSEEKILELTAREENLLLSSVSQNGYAVVNIDDPLIKGNIKRIKADTVTVSSKDSSANIYIKKIDSDLQKFTVELVIDGKNYKINISSSLPDHYAYSFALAIGVVKSVGVSVDKAISRLEKNFFLPPGRMTIFKGIKETKIIDSSYNNATLPPLLDLLSFLKEKSGLGRKVAIIGDMRELGRLSRKMHETAAKKIVESVDFAVIIGPLMFKYAQPILEKSKLNFAAFENFTSAKQYILDNIKKGDTILVKSSQNTLFLERVVAMLLSDKDDVKKLCRRGDFWNNQRSKSK